MNVERQSFVLCLVGPAGSGKTSLAKRLLEEPGSNLVKSISATSRDPRQTEVDGKNYIFMSRDDFEAAVKRDEFFEWEEVHGNLYGQLKSSLQSCLDSGTDVVLDIDIRGANSVKAGYPERTVVVFLLPPSKAVLQKRLLARGPMEAKELATRMATAEGELKRLTDAKEQVVDYVVINGDFEETLQALWNIVRSERQRLGRINQPWLKKFATSAS